MHRQNMLTDAENLFLCLLCHPRTEARSLGVCVEAGVRVCVKLTIAAELGLLQEKVFT